MENEKQKSIEYPQENFLEKQKLLVCKYDVQKSGMDLAYTIDSAIANVYNFLETGENNNKHIFTDCTFKINEDQELDKNDTLTLGAYVDEGSLLLSNNFKNRLIRNNNRFLYEYRGGGILNLKQLQETFFSPITPGKGHSDFEDIYAAYKTINFFLIKAKIPPRILYKLLLMTIENKKTISEL